MKLEKTLYLLAMLALLAAGSALAANGKVESVDLLEKIRPGVTTVQQVRDLLGAPANSMHFPARGIDTLEYVAYDFGRLLISISYGSDGVVREVLRMRPSAP